MNRNKFILATLAIIGAALRIVPVWAMPTWYDENFSLLLARLPFDRMIVATSGDVHPPLWYAICWLFAQVPGLPGWAVIRLPALLASLASMWLFWKICKISFWTSRVKLIAFGLFAILPTQIYYAQEGRQYALLALLVLWAWLAMSKREWVWLFVSTLLMLYLHNYGMFYSAAIWLAGLVDELEIWQPKEEQRTNIFRMTLAIGSAGLLFLPWLVVLFAQMHAIDGSYWMVYSSAPFALGDLMHAMFGGGQMGSDLYNFAIFYALLGWTTYVLIRNRSLEISGAIIILAPWLMAVIVSVLWQPVLLYRALVPCAAFLVLQVAKAFDDTWTVSRRNALIAAVIFLPAVLVNTIAVAQKSTWKTSLDDTVAMMKTIDADWQDGDLLIHADDGIYITGSAYWSNVDNTLRVQPCGPVFGGITSVTRDALGIVTGPLSEDYPGRVWVVTSETPMNPTCEQDALQAAGLLDSEPLMCIDNPIVRSCLYLNRGAR